MNNITLYLICGLSSVLGALAVAERSTHAVREAAARSCASQAAALDEATACYTDRGLVQPQSDEE
jgi:hypothetical protein